MSWLTPRRSSKNDDQPAQLIYQFSPKVLSFQCITPSKITLKSKSDILVVELRPHQPTAQPTSLTEGFWADQLLYGTNVKNYVNQQTLKPDDDYVLPRQHLWTFDILVCPLSVTEHFLLQPLMSQTVFHRTSLLPPPCQSSAVMLNRISSHCAHTATHHFGHYNRYYFWHLTFLQSEISLLLSPWPHCPLVFHMFHKLSPLGFVCRHSAQGARY